MIPNAFSMVAMYMVFLLRRFLGGYIPFPAAYSSTKNPKLTANGDKAQILKFIIN